jgi:hypothetical protein
MNSPQVSYVLKLGIGIAGIGVALIAVGIAELDHALHGGTGLGVMVVLVGVVGLGLGGYLIWGYGWLKRRPEVVKKAEQGASLNRHGGPEEGREN